MIREFKPRDFKKILQIEKTSFRDPWSKWEFLYHCRHSNFLVYEVDGEVVGYIISNSNGHISNIAVDPEYRRNKIGTKLVQEIVGKTKNALVEVRKSNKVAQEFYKSLRFREMYFIPRYYGNEDALVMALSNFDKNNKKSSYKHRKD